MKETVGVQAANSGDFLKQFMAAQTDCAGAEPIRDITSKVNKNASDVKVGCEGGKKSIFVKVREGKKGKTGSVCEEEQLHGN